MQKFKNFMREGPSYDASMNFAAGGFVVFVTSSTPSIYILYTELAPHVVLVTAK